MRRRIFCCQDQEPLNSLDWRSTWSRSAVEDDVSAASNSFSCRQVSDLHVPKTTSLCWSMLSVDFCGCGCGAGMVDCRRRRRNTASITDIDMRRSCDLLRPGGVTGSIPPSRVTWPATPALSTNSFSLLSADWTGCFSAPELAAPCSVPDVDPRGAGSSSRQRAVDLFVGDPCTTFSSFRPRRLPATPEDPGEFSLLIDASDDTRSSRQTSGSDAVEETMLGRWPWPWPWPSLVTDAIVEMSRPLTHNLISFPCSGTDWKQDDLELWQFRGQINSSLPRSNWRSRHQTVNPDHSTTVTSPAVHGIVSDLHKSWRSLGWDFKVTSELRHCYCIMLYAAETWTCCTHKSHLMYMHYYMHISLVAIVVRRMQSRRQSMECCRLSANRNSRPSGRNTSNTSESGVRSLTIKTQLSTALRSWTVTERERERERASSIEDTADDDASGPLPMATEQAAAEATAVLWESKACYQSLSAQDCKACSNQPLW